MTLKIISTKMLKSLEKFLRSTIFISFLVLENSFAQFLFTPFENETSYKGSWNLAEEIPNYIAAYVRELYKANVLSSTAFISLAQKKNIDEADIYDLQAYTSVANDIGCLYIVTGKVLDFDIGRFSAGETNIAGYEAYSCEINIFIRIFDLSQNISVFSGEIESSIANRSLGINLFGLPSDEKKQYLALNKIRFGSEEFQKTIVGETMLQLCENLTSDMKQKNKELLFPKKEKPITTEIKDETLDEIKLVFEYIKGSILTYDEKTGEAFINLGSANRLNIGEKLLVYAPADSLFDPSTKEFIGFSDKNISEAQIVEIRGEKLSLAIVEYNREQVKKGMEVRRLVAKKK